MKLIELTQGKSTMVDDEDYDWLIQWKWTVSEKRIGKFCAYRKERLLGEQISVYLHRVILGITRSDVQVDHRDGDGLNNQRYNLRASTNQQNQCNKDNRIDNTSGFKGVYFNKSINKWHARLCANGKNHHLGYFDLDIDAALAYDEAAKQLHGEFAKLNF